MNSLIRVRSLIILPALLIVFASLGGCFLPNDPESANGIRIQEQDLERIANTSQVAQSKFQEIETLRQKIPATEQTQRAFTTLDQLAGKQELEQIWVNKMLQDDGKLSSTSIFLVMFQLLKEQQEDAKQAKQEMRVARDTWIEAQMQQLKNKLEELEKAKQDALNQFGQAYGNTLRSSEMVAVENYRELHRLQVTSSRPAAVLSEVNGPALALLLTCPEKTPVTVKVEDLAKGLVLREIPLEGGAYSFKVDLNPGQFTAVKTSIQARNSSALSWFECSLELKHDIIVNEPPKPLTDDKRRVIVAFGTQLASELEELRSAILQLSFSPTHTIPQDDLDLLSDIQSSLAIGSNAVSILTSDDLKDPKLVDLHDKLSNLSEMSETTSLRLQMTMDRRSKFISTLSNIMKKISTTQETIVQNLK